MKKLFLAVTVLCVLFAAASVSAKVLVEEDFEQVDLGKLPAGWEIISGEPGVYSEQAYSGNKALRIQPPADNASGVLDYVYVPFETQYDKVVVEYMVYTPGTAGRGLAFSVSRQVYEPDPVETYANEAGPYLCVRNGKLSYFSGTWADLMLDFDTTQWNKVKVEVDVKAQSFTVYVNDVEVGQGRFRSPVDSLGLAVFTIFQTGGPSEVAWVDDVKVYVP
ncbi:MAG TPA: hypothetical protein GXX57_09430 [Firmicutes bacterium]|nr:hypothetical protein [Bacillota bacterium]